jgi:hypothetical protein
VTRRSSDEQLVEGGGASKDRLGGGGKAKKAKTSVQQRQQMLEDRDEASPAQTEADETDDVEDGVGIIPVTVSPHHGDVTGGDSVSDSAGKKKRKRLPRKPASTASNSPALLNGSSNQTVGPASSSRLQVTIPADSGSVFNSTSSSRATSSPPMGQRRDSHLLSPSRRHEHKLSLYVVAGSAI